MALPMQGKVIALAEGRQLEELAEMLEKEGATTLRCPLLSILDAPDPAPVLAWLHELIAGRFAWVVLFTGEGLRRLVGCAERDGCREQVVDALRKTNILTRGPKPVRALKEIGLAPTQVAAQPTTDGVIATLRTIDLKGGTVGVQLYSDENPPLIEFLKSAGATVRTVLPYVYAPKSDDSRVLDLIERLATGQVDVIVFTSSPQVDRLFELAGQANNEATLRSGLERCKTAVVGPVVGDNLRERGVRVDIEPQQGFQMKNLVLHIKRALAG
jgi:uroporphyrinogen-III synthase